MKTSFALWIAVCLAVAVTSALVVFSLGRQGTVVTMNASPLHCTVCEPVQDGEIAATSFETVEVVWNVANLSDEVLDGLEARADCRCHVLKAFPDSLKPNETARVSIRVAAPVAGIAERQIPVYCRNRSGPVGTMHVRFRVDVTPPFWIDPPKRVALQGVVGQKSSHEAVWECIEKAGSRRIIEGAELEPHSSALSLSMQVTDVPWGEDGTLLKRKYQLQFSVKPESTDSRDGQIRLLTTSDACVPQVEWRVTTNPGLSAYPPKLAFSSGDASHRTQQVTLVSRIAGGGPITAKFDEGILGVTAVSDAAGAARKFEVSVREKGALSEQCRITFSVAGCELSVPVLVSD